MDRDPNTDSLIEEFLSSPEARRLRAEHAAKILTRRRELAVQLNSISTERATTLPATRQVLVDADRRRKAAYEALQREEAAAFAAGQALLALSVDLDRRQGIVEAELRATASPEIDA